VGFALPAKCGGDRFSDSGWDHDRPDFEVSGADTLYTG
jgi:hypothetical protein